MKAPFLQLVALISLLATNVSAQNFAPDKIDSLRHLNYESKKAEILANISINRLALESNNQKIKLLQYRESRIRWHGKASTGIFWLVIAIVFTGLVFSGIQFYKAMFYTKRVIKAKADGTGSLETKPGDAAKLPMADKPAVAGKPAAEGAPVAGDTPVAEGAPVVENKPVAGGEPAAKSEPASATKTVDDSKTEEDNSHDQIPLDKHSLSISLKGIEISSSVIGLIILVISIAFFYLYLTMVYPLEEENFVKNKVESKEK